MAQQNRRQVSIRTEDWEKAMQLRDKVSQANGRKVTITGHDSKSAWMFRG